MAAWGPSTAPSFAHAVRVASSSSDSSWSRLLQNCSSVCVISEIFLVVFQLDIVVLNRRGILLPIVGVCLIERAANVALRRLCKFTDLVTVEFDRYFHFLAIFEP